MGTTTSLDDTLSKLGIARSGATKNTSTTATPSKGLSEMGPGDFIALLTAQMKNQDPFEPVDNTQMVAQMAQFSSLSATTEMSSTLKTIASKLSQTGAGDAVSYVGKTVLTEGATAYTRSAGGFTGGVELDAPASSVELTIKDSYGTVVRTVDLGAQAKGTASYDWDGSLEDGGTAGTGPFTVSATAKDASGAAINARTLVWAPVSSVSMPTGADPVLTVAGVGQIPTTAVRAIA
ncbi:flagellar hook assembly protein FlgD [Sphingomonas sp. RS2018]